MRRALGIVLVALLVVAVGTLTRFAYRPASAAEASLRLAWRARVPLVEECRRLTEAEQEALPVHMRREVVCEGRVASYRLEVAVDGRVRHRSTVEGAGARGDRPLYVFESMPLEPGRRELHVAFVRLGPESDSTLQTARRGAGTIPTRLELDRTVAVAAGDVVLISYDQARRELVIR